MFETNSNSISMIRNGTHRKDTYGLSAILTVAEAARFMRMNVKTVYQAIDEGTLPGLKVSGRIVILRDALLGHLGGRKG